MAQKIRIVHHSQVEFCLKSVLDHSGSIVENRMFLKYFQMVYNPAIGTMIGHVKINF